MFPFSSLCKFVWSVHTMWTHDAEYIRRLTPIKQANKNACRHNTNATPFNTIRGISICQQYLNSTHSSCYNNYIPSNNNYAYLIRLVVQPELSPSICL